MNKVKVVSLTEWLQDISANSKGIIKVEEPKLLLDSIEQYQTEVLHELSKGIVTQHTIKSLLNTTRQIHSLRNVEFEDESIPQVLLEIFQANLEILGKLSEDMRKELENELTEKAITEGDSQAMYQAMLNDKLNGLVEEYKNKEREEIEKLAEDDVRAIAMGIPASAIHRDFRTGEEKLHDILVSIREEQLAKEKQKLQDLSLFKDSKTLRKYKEHKRHDLDKILSTVSDSVVRNYPREKRLAQGYKAEDE